MSNLLAASTSPYLLQHQSNPVDWHPWGEEAFARAKREEKPIFLSIGYSTCHWCHVMAHESFENPEVAAVLNEYFVSIKVDREERPDVDRLYMTYVQATTGSGGWPMSVWLTPDGKPFFGGTYFPPTDRYGRPGFVTVLERIAELWATERRSVLQQGENVIEGLRGSEPAHQDRSRVPEDQVLADGFAAFARAYDPVEGGFNGGPKFPRPSVFQFLLGCYDRGIPGASGEALEITLHTLRRMAAGGINDHLGGGFHRYSVDGQWHVPHFEKMLYDQAQLVNAYLDAWKITGEALFLKTLRRTVDYVLRDLRHELGGFFSAEDADSAFQHGSTDHGEGAFYVWPAEEIDRLLPEADAGIFKRHYGVESGGNAPAESDPHQEFRGRNILIERESAADLAAAFHTTVEAVEQSLTESRKILFEAREGRPRPHLDDKVLTAWNGMMISALARTGGALQDATALDAAMTAASFLRDHLWDGTRLFRTWRAGQRGEIGAFAEDYACLISGLLDLYEATFDVSWLNWAIELQDILDAQFEDPTGGYYGSSGDDPLVPLRTREDYDGAEPAASSVSALNLVRLSNMLHDPRRMERAERIFSAFAPILTHLPSAVPFMLAALDVARRPPAQAVIAGDPQDPEAVELALRVRSKFNPRQVILCADQGEGQRVLGQFSAALAEMKPLDGHPALYLCEDFVCQAPVRIET